MKLHCLANQTIIFQFAYLDIFKICQGRKRQRKTSLSPPTYSLYKNIDIVEIGCCLRIFSGVALGRSEEHEEEPVHPDGGSSWSSS